MSLKQTSENKKTITVNELASQLGLSRARVYAALRAGEIPSKRVGKRFLIASDTADRLLNCEVKSQG